MNRQYHLHTLYPKQRDLGIGTLAVDHGDANFFSVDGGKDAKLLAVLKRSQLVFAGADMLLLSGLQPDGFARDGRVKYFYQEWALKYT
jgi:hypothetical protein